MVIEEDIEVDMPHVPVPATNMTHTASDEGKHDNIQR